MKVLNWVHRRFLHVHSGVTSLQDDNRITERNGKPKVDVETHALLEHEGILAIGTLVVDVLEDWKEGILAIGTLAIGPLEATISAKCQLLDKQVDDDEENEDDLYHDDKINNYVDPHVLDDDDFESSPLMKVAFFSHELEKMDIGCANEDGAAACKQLKRVGENTAAVNNDPKLGYESDVCNAINADEKEICEIKRRVTLADLFLEESVKETNGSSNYVARNDDSVTGKSSQKMKPTSHAKNGLCKAKKLLREELRPIKKLNQLMKRMMKKKIHPDMAEAGKMQKDINLQPRQAMGIPTPDLDAAYESASLLLLQDSCV